MGHLQSISGENGVAFNALSLCFDAIPDVKPVPTFAKIALVFLRLRQTHRRMVSNG